MTISRRALLEQGAGVSALLLGCGALAPAQATGSGASKAAFEAKSMAEALRALGYAAPQESNQVQLNVPDIAENGAAVPVGVSASLPGVRQLLVLIEKNPAALAAVYHLTPELEPQVLTRVKLSQSSLVYGVAVTQDMRVLYAQREVKVTLGGCGG
ncbi:thiosulfate oxidation carrier protein SoxY [Pelomonas sp. CA6]|uniref:thiosulfate oxidation carrier protein SoxY n=1 Tax=Pelomonas sp. CA6 TaxID=2907999 RepID=UPI001F4C3A2F|nr:thiosulfate oxidation carrier protein SoxY [Pelomonas sp. CA6]MCH7344838.1 thiosulfate oxidation carrier protein SoxY [Pelomonas sp. CA6]